MANLEEGRRRNALKVYSIVGQVFNDIRVLGIQGITNNQSIAICVCNCGNFFTAVACRIKTGHRKSCGCILSKITKKRLVKHGFSKHHLFSVWKNMIRRCYNKKSSNYHSYGGVGVEVCDRWRFGEDGKHPFALFLADMGERPDGLSIERCDNNLGYFPGNCRWANCLDQARNRRNTVHIHTPSGTYSFAEFCRVSGVSKERIKIVMKKNQVDALTAACLIKQGRVPDAGAARAATFC